MIKVLAFVVGLWCFFVGAMYWDAFYFAMGITIMALAILAR